MVEVHKSCKEPLWSCQLLKIMANVHKSMNALLAIRLLFHGRGKGA